MMRGYYQNQPRGFSGFGFGPGKGMGPGVKYLLIANVVIFLIQKLVGDQMMVQSLGLVPIRVLKDLAVYQLFTYMFLHGGFFHILMNMFILWMFGTEIELTWGTRRFLKYYFLCGIAGGLFTVMFLPNSPVPTIGASGAIYGLLVAYAIMFPNRLLYIFFLFPVKVKWAVLAFVALEFFASFNAATSTIGHLAHLGGAVVGFIYLKMDWRFRRIFQKLNPWHWFTSVRYKSRVHKMEKNRQKTEDIMKRVDEILDKINAVGIENISEEDRQFLGSASDILSKKDK